MFNKEKRELDKLGATITTKEISQQPLLWDEVLDNYKSQQATINHPM